MFRKTVCATAVAVTVASVMMSMTVMAQEEPEVIAVPYLQEDAWEEIAMTNDDAVNTGVNIRSTANENGEIIGYLYHGGAAWVVKKGEEWTEIYSGGLTGFVKNEYLMFGDEVKGLADHYGIEGVSTTWEDVKLFATEGGGSDVVDELGTGESFILLQDNGHWLQVQRGADDTAYVSSEDVTRVLLLETAVAKDDVYTGTAETYTETEPVYTETEPVYTETEPTYTETEPVYTETEPAYTETEPVYTETEPEYTETEPEYTETETEYTQTETTDDGSIDDVSDGGYYDADTDTYYDANGNVVDAASYDSQYAETEYIETEYTETEYTQTEYVETEAPQTEYVETEAPQTEAPQTEAPSTEAAATGTDDTSLLAALIYCEAGNQSYEGMVAVGAVVMNRVYSDSFPNTISEVIYQGGQFTPASSGSLASALANGVPSTCYDAAAAAISGNNPVGGALYFNTGSGKGIKIGDHQFY